MDLALGIIGVMTLALLAEGAWALDAGRKRRRGPTAPAPYDREAEPDSPVRARGGWRW